MSLLFVLLIAAAGFLLFGPMGAAGGLITGIALVVLFKIFDGFLNLISTKHCPYCSEQIKREANVCRYCGRDI